MNRVPTTVISVLNQWYQNYSRLAKHFLRTHKAELMGVPATERQATVPVLITDHIAGDKIAETWAEWNPDDMMRQLGLRA